MDKETESNIDKRMIAFAASASLAQAIKTAAEKEFVSQSDICRRVVIADMRERGLLPEKGI
jgi:hypothetical protein